MVTKVEGYQCELCGELWSTPELAEYCEKMHVPSDSLEISQVTHSKPDDLNEYWETSCGYFPTEIIVEKKDYSGTAAKYVLQKAGSVEDIYTEED